MGETKIANQVANLITSENIQKYVFGHKKNGEPRALYDIVKDVMNFKKKKKKKKTKLDSFSLELVGKKKKKKRKKKDKF